ncbi:MAG TPA: DUF4855 domain-containing protein [Bacillota bacterium]|nr:DUF4855 domain-containing protein [Bacillota bacterium]
MAGYPFPNTCGLEHLFLAYTGFSIGQDGSHHHQYWEPADLFPVLAWLEPGTGQGRQVLFTDFLLPASAVIRPDGTVKYLIRDDNHPAEPKDWQLYLEELFSPGRNLNALFTVSLHNPLSRFIPIDIWIALPYPHPRVFYSDKGRVAGVRDWVEEFLRRWDQGNYGQRLNLRGFYWLQESLYYQGSRFNDSEVISRINRHVHTLHHRGRQLKMLWIPYQQAAGWNRWQDLGFDVSILQPSYLFKPELLLENAACDSYENGQGVEMELDLGVLQDQQKRSRFLEYLDLGLRGGMDQRGRYFGPYLRESVVGWYLGGWYWSGETRKHILHSLHTAGDPLYVKLRDLVKCQE